MPDRRAEAAAILRPDLGPDFGPVVDAPTQAVILVLVSSALQRPAFEALCRHGIRLGFRRLTVLTADRPASNPLVGAMRSSSADISIEIVETDRDPVRALRGATAQLDERFLLLDGSCYFDSNWLDLVPALAAETLVVSLRRHTPGESTPAGVYLASRNVIAHLPESGELEQALSQIGSRFVAQRLHDGAFVPSGATREAVESVVARPRGAVFFDRDGTINVNKHYPHKGEQLQFLPGAIDAVKHVNDLGYWAFLVTNQSGVARGYFAEAQVQAFHALMQRHLRAAGAHFDDIRYCPYLKGADVAAYDRDSGWRKPAPGMILDLVQHWPVDRARSIVIGDQDSDVQAAAAAKLSGVLYSGGRVDETLAAYLDGKAQPRP